MDRRKLISVVSPCYNEEENVAAAYEEVRQVFARYPQYRYEHIFIDNASTDRTVAKLREIARRDPNLKIIVNIRNFGQSRSPFYAMLQAEGDAVITFTSDLQDPAALMHDFLRKWEEGYDAVIGIKAQTAGSPLVTALRSVYYFIIGKLAETEQIKNFTGYGLYDRSFVDVLRRLRITYPYFRGLVAMFAGNRAEIPYVQPERRGGKTKNNLYTLFDYAMLGFANHSRVPLRLASFLGFSVAALSFLVGLVYLIYKLVFWDRFQLGVAPIVIGLFLFSAVQLICLGLLGEYVGLIFTQVKEFPLVVERERVNFVRPSEGSARPA